MDMFIFVPAHHLTFTRPADTLNQCKILAGREAGVQVATERARERFLTFFREHDLNEPECTLTVFEEHVRDDLLCINVSIHTPEAANTYSYYLYRKTVVHSDAVDYLISALRENVDKR